MTVDDYEKRANYVQDGKTFTIIKVSLSLAILYSNSRLLAIYRLHLTRPIAPMAMSIWCFSLDMPQSWLCTLGASVPNAAKKLYC